LAGIDMENQNRMETGGGGPTPKNPGNPLSLGLFAMALSLVPGVVSAQTQTERALGIVATKATAFEEYYAGKCRGFVPSKGEIDARLQTLKDYAEKVKSDPGLCGNSPPPAPATQPVIQVIKAAVNEPEVREEPAVQPKAAEPVVINVSVVEEPAKPKPEPIVAEVVAPAPTTAPETPPEPEKSEPAKAPEPATPAPAKASEPAKAQEPPKITMSSECATLLAAINKGTINCNLGNYYDATQCKDTSGNLMSAAFLGKCGACKGKDAKENGYKTPCATPTQAPAKPAQTATPAVKATTATVASAAASKPETKPATTTTKTQSTTVQTADTQTDLKGNCSTQAFDLSTAARDSAEKVCKDYGGICEYKSSKGAYYCKCNRPRECEVVNTTIQAKPVETPKPVAPVVETKPPAQIIVVPAAHKCPMDPMTEAEAKTTCKPFKGYCKGGIGLIESEKGQKEYTCDCSEWCKGSKMKVVKIQ